MNFKPVIKQPGFTEFVILVAFIISLVALSIDAMLPALPLIAADLNFTNADDGHFIVSMLFVGMGFGQMIFGPMSDSTGRKPAIIAGIAINEINKTEPANAGINPAPVSKSRMKKRIAARTAFITAPITHIKILHEK